jgi:hypothetical protein
MPKRKRRTKSQPKAAQAPEPIAKIKKRRRRRRRPVAEPIALPEPKTLMDRIFESQRAELNQMQERLRAKLA